MKAWTVLGRIFVACPPAGLIDKQHWAGIVWCVGTYSFIGSDGIRATIPRYTVSPDEAYRALAQAPSPID